MYATYSFLPGSVCDFRLSYGRVLSRRSKIIALNRNKFAVESLCPASNPHQRNNAEEH
jgi:hypothetical protein